MKPIIEYKLKEKNQILKIYQDPSPESPNDWGDEEIFLVYDHRQFQVNRDGFEPEQIHEYLQLKERFKNNKLEDFEDATQEAAEYSDYINYEDRFADYYIFGVDAYIHSGVTLSLSGKTDFPDRRWDVSTTGFILVKKDIKDDLNEEDAEEYVENLIKNWNTYLEGNVYGFKLFDIDEKYTISKQLFDTLIPINIKTSTSIIKTIQIEHFKNLARITEEENEIDSCWGFYEDGNIIKNGYENIFDRLGLKLEELEEI